MMPDIEPPGVSVSRLFIYPVKSCGGIEVREAVVEKRGFRHDRRWMVVDRNGIYMTQRNHPRLALIRTTIAADGLHLSARGMTESVTPLEPDDGDPVDVVVWEDRISVRSVDRRIDRRLSDFMQMECRLVYFPGTTKRTVDPKYGKDGDEVGFADSFPFLILTQSSLDDLNRRLNEPLPVNRFRPNILLRGNEPYEEDRWSSVRIGTIPFRLPKPCARCVTTTVDQETAATGSEPLRTFSAYRLSADRKPLFGWKAIADAPGLIRCGDRVEVSGFRASESIPVTRQAVP